jgi:hypothetical protein
MAVVAITAEITHAMARKLPQVVHKTAGLHMMATAMETTRTVTTPITIATAAVDTTAEMVHVTVQNTT